jgi:rare lipoprotein A
MRRNAKNVNRKMPLPFWLLVGVSCVALAAAILTFFPRIVLANALLPKATVVAPSAPVVSKPTPTFVEDVQAEKKIPAHLLHGVASWYGSVFNGRQTASGETFNMYAMTACHPTLPFGTKVRVVNTANHKSVVVRITDRGLLYDGRILDLSYGAAQKLGIVNMGLARVKIQVLKSADPQQNQ